MAAPVITPLPTAPDRATGGTQFDIDATAWAAALPTWTTQVGSVGDFCEVKAGEALAAALGGSLPPLTGHSLQYIRVNAGETAAEFMTLPAASEIVPGIIEKATLAEALAGAADKYPDAANVLAMIAPQIALRGAPDGMFHYQTFGVGAVAAWPSALANLTFNATSINNLGIVLSANQFTNLAAGTYFAEWEATCDRTGKSSKAMASTSLYDVTGAAALGASASAYCGPYSAIMLKGSAYFTIGVTSTVTLRGYSDYTNCDQGSGVSDGQTHNNTTIKFWKVA